MIHKNVEVEIDVSISDFEDDEILKEADRIVKKNLKENKSRAFLALRKTILGNLDFEIKIETADDVMKLEHLAKIFRKYSTEFIEKQLPC